MGQNQAPSSSSVASSTGMTVVTTRDLDAMKSALKSALTERAYRRSLCPCLFCCYGTSEYLESIFELTGDELNEQGVFYYNVSSVFQNS
jgi:hypothetical protein